MMLCYVQFSLQVVLVSVWLAEQLAVEDGLVDMQDLLDR